MPSKVGVSIDVDADGVAVITICNPPVNALSPAIYAGLKEKYVEAMKRDDVKAIVLTGADGNFSGGFDINVFVEVQKTDGRKPSVAAIQGLALGGGLELTMSCHARISTPESRLGLPELTLGVIPGFGGTQRLPRLVGLPKAVEMMLQSKPIRATEGKYFGIVDVVATPQELLKISKLWALNIAARHKPWLSSLHRTDRIGSLSEARETLKSARQQAKNIARNMPQHQACLDVIEEGVNFGGYAGVLKEAKVFRELVFQITARGLVHFFFAQRATTKVPNVTDVGLRPRELKKVAVIGGGLMGSGIATALILSNIFVVMKEIDSIALLKSFKAIEANLQGLVKKGSLTQDKMKNALSLLKGVLDYSEFKNVDMVIEAVVENVSLKQSIFSDLEKYCTPHCILATNTSTINLNIVGEKTRSQDRIIGAHFFSPAHVMPLLEIVRSDRTSPQVILDLINVGKAIKKVPIVVGNCTAFAVNRSFFPYGQGAAFLVHLGVDLFRVDRVMTDFGMPMGPFQLQDVGGYGVALAAKSIYDSAFGDRMFKSDLFALLVKDGRQGKANGKGLYLHEKGQKPKPDLSVIPIIEESIRRANIMPGGKPITISDQEVLEMILFPVVNEAYRVVEEGVVARASDLDVASILGMGFPRYRGGILFWADTVGSGYIFSKLQKWTALYGNFFRPSEYLEERAKHDIPLGQRSLATSGTSRARM